MAWEGEGGKRREPLVGGLSAGTDRKRVSRDVPPKWRQDRPFSAIIHLRLATIERRSSSFF